MCLIGTLFLVTTRGKPSVVCDATMERTRILLSAKLEFYYFLHRQISRPVGSHDEEGDDDQ